MDRTLERYIAEANRQIYLGDLSLAQTLVHQADRRLVSLLLGAGTQKRYDALCYYQYRLLAVYMSALYRRHRENLFSTY